MKKYLLVLCLCGGMATLSAQQAADFSASKANVMTTVPFDAQRTNVTLQKNAPYSAELNMLKDEAGTTHTARALYRLPAGSLYAAMIPEWRSYASTYVYTPALKELTWENYCKLDDAYARDDKNVGWTRLSNDEEILLDSLMDEKGNLVMSFYGGNYIPEVHVFAPEDEMHAEALDSYYFYADEEDPETTYLMGGMDTLEYLGNACINGGLYGGFSEGGAFVSNQNFLVLEKDESGNVRWKDTGKKCVGFAELYDAPADMLFVSSVYICMDADGTAPAGSPLEGKTLTANVYRVTDDGFVALATATATEEDVVYNSSDKPCSVIFRFVEDDPIFGKTDAPIVLDNTSDYLFTITGFSELSAEWTCVFSGADGFRGHGYALLEDGSLATIGYSNALTTPQIDLHISLEAVMPVAQVVEGYEDIVVDMPVEGGYGRTTYDEETQKWYNDFEIYTLNSSDWWEEIDAPAWIDGIEYDDEYIDYGYLFVFLHALPLPAGTDYRSGEVVLSLYGKDIVIPVAQGEQPTGLAERRADKKNVYFNVLGQQEQIPVAGKVYISDGQKVIF